MKNGEIGAIVRVDTDGTANVTPLWAAAPRWSSCG
jgi:hypothetical protein